MGELHTTKSVFGKTLPNRDHTGPVKACLRFVACVEPYPSLSHFAGFLSPTNRNSGNSSKIGLKR